MRLLLLALILALSPLLALATERHPAASAARAAAHSSASASTAPMSSDTSVIALPGVGAKVAGACKS